MNIHPLFAHFPIGILVLYTAFELLRFKFIIKQPYYFQFKAMLVIIGSVTAYLAALTGGLAEDLIEQANPSQLPLVEIHSMYAVVTIVLYSILGISYLFEWFKLKKVLGIITRISRFQKTSTFIQRLAPVFASTGLIAITITGALGAAIVYGHDVDPVVRIIYYIIADPFL